MDLLTREEKERILYEFNQTKTEYPRDKTIIELFEEEVIKKPDQLAVVSEEEEITYAQLNEKASCLGEQIREKGIQPGEFVAIMAHRRVSTIIGIIAVLKSGAAYLPLDPECPAERNNYILKDSKCRILLADTPSAEFIGDCAAAVLPIRDNGIGCMELENISKKINTSSRDLAYLIYTSGTTGVPKGVMIEHRSVIRLVKNTNYVDFTNIRILQTGALTFDASTFEIWGALLNGGTLYIVDENVLTDINLLEMIIGRYRINTMFLTTALYNQLISLNDSIFDGLDQLLFGGEVTSEEHVKKLCSRNKKIYFANVYGPTENTTFTTYYPITKETLLEKTPIGKPISNTTVYILNGKKLSGIGMPGELCIGGDGLSRGYLNSPELSDEKYIDHPYIKGEKIYRTGDLARWTEDGDIEYLGRIDEQLKIRGFRIEPGEIESKLREIKSIEDAVVIAKEKNGSKYLYGYVVSDENINVDGIKNQLREMLPDYMIPTYLMVLDKLPLTRNGKVDKKALPVPELVTTQKYIAPTTEVERDIVNAFEEILGNKCVGVMDNFFELGGDSIKAIRIISQLRKKGYKLSLKEIMRLKIVGEIAEQITKKEVQEAEFKEIEGETVLTPIQKVFFEYDLNVPEHFNQSFVLESQEKISEKHLKIALTEIAKHHDMLRAVYTGQQQKILPISESRLCDLSSFDLTNVTCEEDVLKQIDEESSKIQGSINLVTGPLFKAGLFQTCHCDYIVLCAHHLVVDGVSWRIIIEDLVQGYHAAKVSKEISLPSKTVSFQQWSEALTAYRESFLLKREIPYWTEIERQVTKAKIKRNADGTEFGLGELSVSLNEEETSQLMQQVGKLYHTEINDLLLTALFRSIHKVTGQQTVAVLLEGHGREELDQSLPIDRTVGWFTSAFPVTAEKVGRTLTEDLRAVKEMVRRIPNHGIGYGILDKLGEKVLKGLKPEIVFNYLGEFGQEEALEEFHICNIRHGLDSSEQNEIHTEISIYGMVTDKKLELSMVYNKQYYDCAFMEELQMYFESQLQEVIHYQADYNYVDYTASDLGELKWSDQEFIKVYEEYQKKGYKIEKIYPLTSLQEGMLYHKLEDEDGSSYVVQNVFKLANNIKEQAFLTSLQLLGEKHEILRTSVVYRNVDEPRQVILKGRKLEYESIDLTNETDAETKYVQIRDHDIKRGFDLEQDSLFRIKLLQIDENKSYLIMSFHHCILDGWCMSVLMNDLLSFYDQVSNGKQFEEISNTFKKGVTFEDYVRFTQSKDRESGQKYWSDLIEGYEEKIGIHPEGRIDEFKDQVGSVKIVLSEDKCKRLEEISKKYEVTFNTIVEAAWGILLQKYNHTNDVVFGKVVSGRNAEMKGIEEIVGAFINTVVIRVQSEGKSFKELLIELQQQSIKGYQYDYCALNEIKNTATTGGDLFDTLMAFENYYIQEPDRETQLKLDFKENREQTNYPLTFVAYLQKGLILDIRYYTSIYGKAEVERIINRLKTILLSVADNPEIAIADIELLIPSEQETILTVFNNTQIKYPDDKTIIELFEEQAEKMSSEIAVVAGNESITYEQLNTKANKLGKQLRDLGVGPDDLVGIIAERKLSTIIGILGVLKSGGAYLPLDPNYPEERIEYILKDSGCKVVLTAGEECESATAVLPTTVDLLNFELLQKEVVANLEKINRSSNDLAYLIYTSGTTGEPKGVMIEQKSVNRLVKNTDYMDFTDVRILQTGALTFDASTFEIWGALLNGGKLYIVTEEVLTDMDQLEKVIKQYCINTMFLTTALYNQLIDINDRIFDSLNQLLFGGEATSEEHVRKLWKRNKGIRFSNVYGPTESTTFATHYPITADRLRTKTPIGKPIANTTAYIFNGRIMCGVGMTGELCLGGDGLSRGYLNSEELNQAKYFDHPYQRGIRLYKTGDLARWTEDGNIEYLGRVDEQVKIRGFRIEPGEIEGQLRKIEHIENAAVITRVKDGSKYLCAYIVSHVSVDTENIKEQLGEVLPNYMIPSYITVLESLPLNRNGKLDKNALPVPEISVIRKYVEPTTEKERDVARAFEEVLGLEQVGVDDNFFEMGGDSIKAIRIISQLRKLGYKLNVKEIMKQKTVRKIAERLVKKEILGENFEEVTGSVKLTPIQKVFFRYQLSVPEHFNQSFVLESQNRIDEHYLRQSLAAIGRHHDMLRTVYDGEHQTILPISESPLLDLAVFDFTDIQDWNEVLELIDAESNKIQESIDLSIGLLLKSGLFHTKVGDYIVLCIHHLVVDGISWRIIIEDLIKGYKQAASSKEIQLPSKTMSFQQWSDALSAYRDSFLLKREIPYWTEIEDKAQKAKIKKSADGTETGLDELIIQLSEADTKKLLQQVGKMYHAEINDLLLTALFRAIHKVTRQQAMAVLLEGHGREELDQPLTIDRTVGWFTSIFPVAIDGIGTNLTEDLRAVKEMVRKIPNHGIGYGILNEMGEKVLKGVKPEIVFNYLGEFGQEEAVEGFQFSRIAHGMDSSQHNEIHTDISIYGLITNNEFRLSLIYNKQSYGSAFMEELQMYFENQLYEIINYQMSAYEVSYTASDLGELSWNDREFIEVYQEFDRQGYEIEKIYPLTGLQAGMLYHKLDEEEGSSYVIQNVFQISSTPDEQALESSFHLLSEKHEILRTSIVYKKVSEARQVILKGRKLEFDSIDLSNEINAEAKFKRIKAQDIKRGFDLEQDSLFRVKLLKIQEDHYYMIMSFHHSILDGWCMSILMNDLLQFYGEIYNGKEDEELLSSIKSSVTFEEYVRFNQNKDQESARAYWNKLIDGYEDKIGIQPEGRVDKAEDETGSIKIILSEIESKKIEEISKKYEVTLNTIVEAAWGILLQKYNHTDDVVFGKVVSGRNAEMKGIEDIVGLFINTILVRVEAKNKSFSALLAELQQQSINGYQYDYCALHEIKTASVTGGELFDTLMVFENYYSRDGGPDTGLNLEFKENREQTNYPLTFTAFVNEGLNLDLMYDTRLYGKVEAERIINRLRMILLNIVENPDIAVEDIEMLSAAEKQQVLCEFNQTETAYPREKTIIELFEEQVDRTPDNIAVEFEGSVLTYAELNERANFIGKELRKLGAEPDTIVGIVFGKSLEMIVAIYGVLKSGAAYMPIDIEAPVDRVRYMIEDSDTKIILVGHGCNQKIRELDEVTVIDLINAIGKQSENLSHWAKPDNLAYVIYTSGTTGRPKGVMVENRGVVNISIWYQQEKFYQDSVIMQNYNFIFDASVAEIFPAGLTGSKLLILSESQRNDPEELLKLLPGKQLSMIPSMFRVLLEHAQIHRKEGVFKEFDKIYLGAEQLPRDLLEKYQKLTGNGLERIYNIYGPTEGTDTVITYHLESRTDTDIIPIGRPIANVRAYILNGKMICGVGVLGELCIGGEGVARGYLNNPELTKQKFVENPYEKGSRIYKTGDLARWMADGNIEFLGRIDEQVKIRGFRIELGEIESKLREIRNIKDAAVIVKEKLDTKYLCAYIVCSESVVVDQVKERLNDKLPHYMIPAYIMQLDKLPLNRNGKLDKKALPDPDFKVTQKFIEPRNEEESCLAKAFKEILGVDRVGIDDNFFDLGGDSIKAMRVISKLREYGYKLKVRRLMQEKTIKKIAKFLTNIEILDLDYQEVQGDVPLTPIQKEFFRFDLSKPEHYNQSLVLESREAIDCDLLGRALAALAEHHDMLRAVYQGTVQKILPIAESKLYQLTNFDFTKFTSDCELYQQLDMKSNEIQSSINLSEGPLLKAGLFHARDRDYIMLCIHHLVVDGVSWRIIIEDLIKSYQSLKQGIRVLLPSKTTSFLKWSQALQDYRESDLLKQEIPYWAEVDQLIQAGKLEPDVTNAGKGYQELHFSLSAEYTNYLLYKANRSYDTEINELLVVAVCRAIYKSTHQTTVSLLMEGHGREELDKPIEVDRTVGWFTTTYPIVVDGIGQTFESDISIIKERLRDVPNYGIGYGVLKELGEVVMNGDEPAITFNYLGEMDQEETAEGFEISNIPHGSDSSAENVEILGIALNSQIVNKEFEMSIFYNSGKYSDEFMKLFMDHLKEQLLEVLDHCINVRKNIQGNQTDYSKRFNIVQFIWSEFGKDSILKPIKVETQSYSILFVKDLDITLREQIRENLIRQTSFSRMPHYILNMKQAQRTSSVMDKKAFREMCSDPAVAETALPVKLDLDHFYRNIENDVNSQYEISAMQRFYFEILGKTNTIVQDSIIIDGNYSPNEIVDAYRKIVQEQAIFRSLLKITDENYTIIEYESDPSWYIPYFDLTYQDAKNINEFYETLEQMINGEHILNGKNYLSRLLVTKESERHYVVHFIVHHGIWNKTSDFIFNERFQELLNKSSNRTKIKQTYKQFIGEVHDCVKMSQRINIEGTIDLKKYIKISDEYEKDNEENKIEKSMALLVKMGSNVIDLYQNDPWKLIIHVFRIMAKENGLITDHNTKIPMFVLTEERRYMKGDYTNTLGGFLDKMPILVDHHQDILTDKIGTKINEIQKLKMDCHLNYFELLAAQRKGFYASSAKILTINYQGEYELSYETVQEYLNVGEMVYTSEVFINRYADNLVIFSPIFTKLNQRMSEGGKDILEKSIQSELNLLEQRLIDQQSSETQVIDEAAATLNHEILAEEIIEDIKMCPGGQEGCNDLLITGVTGFLGAHTLAQILETSPDRHIYCMIRGTEVERVRNTLVHYNLWKGEFDSRFTVILGDLSVKQFGLSDSIYQKLLLHISQILHIAADTNHVKTYSQLRDTNVQGTIELIRLAAKIRKKEFIYISTLSVLDHLGNNNEEAELTNPELLDMGYIQTKYMSEKLLLQAKEAGLKVNIIRVGRVAPSTVTGIWRDTDGYNMLFESFYRLNMVPEIKSLPLFFTPVDYMSDCINKIISCDLSSDGLILHLHNNKALIWLKDCYQALKIIKPSCKWVSHREWYETLTNSKEPELQMCQYIADMYFPMELEELESFEYTPISTQKTDEIFVQMGIPILMELPDNYLVKVFNEIKACIEKLK